MSRKKNSSNHSSEERDSRETVQNSPPFPMWRDFDQFWSSAVKNGTPILKAALRAHFKSLGIMDHPDQYIKGALHFGIDVEK